MTDDNLTPSETAMLLLLMAENREISNPELKDKYGVTLTGTSRQKLEKRELVESRKGLRGAFFYTLSEAGWARCNDGFDVGDVRPRAAGQALTAVMAGLQRYLHLKGLKMVHIFAPETVPDRERDERATDLEAQVRKAYRKLRAGPGEWVNLADLRPLLHGASKSEVDKALIHMIEQSDDVNLVPESKQSDLTDAMRRAAVRVGDQDKHLLSIGAP
jgi:hypothetical protein